MEMAWLIPLFPLASFFVLLVFGKHLRERSAFIACLLMLFSTLFAFMVFFERLSEETIKREFYWFSIGQVEVTVGFQITALNALMLLVVSIISLLVHLYSVGYMKGNERFPIFYAYLGLFTFSMLELVMTTNLLQLYFFWELVGLGSFLLIGFYFNREKAKAAAKKAFIMTRIGDVGLFVAMVLLFIHVGSFTYEDIFRSVQQGELSSSFVTTVAILIFIGAIGKSGQFPLHTWLPDAMEGPTPVSALIHAATMVAAGVYLVAYMYPIFLASETALMTVSTVGGVTAIFAASIALAQTDIKRILAYSTISQLGYMMLALGATGYVAAIFHLTTHAFFKALLFLAAGSVIHIVHTQSIDKMGGLREARWTTTSFVIGALSLSGVPLFSGFFSKEEIFVSVWTSGNGGLFFLAVLTALFTAFYMFRVVFLVFGGEKVDKGASYQESSSFMKWVMGVLSIFAILVGFINSAFMNYPLDTWLKSDVTWQVAHHEAPSWLMFVSVSVSFSGILLAYLMYRTPSIISRNWLSARVPHVTHLLKHKYFIDELYERTVILFVKALAKIGAVFDRYGIYGFVNGVAQFMMWLGKTGAKAQTGKTQHYGVVAFGGLAILLVIYFWMGGV